MSNKRNGNGKRCLLLTSCSQLKRKNSNLEAIDLYDGPSFKIIRKHRNSNLDILIISAKYGLIDSTEQIGYYDKKMSIERALELQENITSILRRKFDSSVYSAILVNLSKNYYFAVDWTSLMYDGDISWTQGPIGMRLHQLREWLMVNKGGGALTNDFN